MLKLFQQSCLLGLKFCLIEGDHELRSRVEVSMFMMKPQSPQSNTSNKCSPKAPRSESHCTICVAFALATGYDPLRGRGIISMRALFGEGIGFAIPVESIKGALPTLLARKKVPKIRRKGMAEQGWIWLRCWWFLSGPSGPQQEHTGTIGHRWAFSVRPEPHQLLAECELSW